MQTKKQIDFKAQALKAYQTAKSYMRKQGWNQFSSKPCLQYTIKEGQRNVIKSVHQFYCSDIQKLIEYMDSPDCIKDTDSLCQTVEELLKEGQYQINHLKFKGLMLVSKRDFVVAAVTIKQENKYYLVCKSIDYIKQLKGSVRGQIHLGAYVVQKLQGENVRITYFSDSDIKGSIPEMVKNMISKQQGVVPVNIQKKFNEWINKSKK